jgi:hypothetical protein
MWLYLFVHALGGALAGMGLQYLIAAGRTGKFSFINWVALLGLYSLIYWFSDYVGGQVRNQTFEQDIEGLSVVLMVISFVAGYVARAWFSSPRQR